MIAHETGDEEFGSDAVGPSEAESVMDEERIADWLVDHAV